MNQYISQYGLHRKAHIHETIRDNLQSNYRLIALRRTTQDYINMPLLRISIIALRKRIGTKQSTYQYISITAQIVLLFSTSPNKNN